MNRSRFFPLIVTGLLFTMIFAFTSIYILLNKNEGFVYYLSNYNSIYNPIEFISIESIEEVESDTIMIVLNSTTEISGWNIKINDTVQYFTSNSFPRVHLPITGDTYLSKIDVYNQTNEVYFDMVLQRQNNGDLHIVNSSIPFIGTSGYSIKDFCNVDWIDKSERDNILKILKNDLLIDTCSNTLSKIEVISTYLNYISRRVENLPLRYSWNSNTAYEIFQKAFEGKTRLECNEYSEVYYVFANLAGVYTRRIAVVGYAKSDGVAKLSGHHFNESFIVEQGKWAFVDVTSYKAYVTNNSNNILNTFELFMANISNNFTGLNAAALKGDSLVMVKYSSINYNERYYFNKDCIIQYKFGNDRFNLFNQFERFVFRPEPVLSLNYANDKIYFKLFSIYTFLISLIFTIIFIVKYIFADRVSK